MKNLSVLLSMIIWLTAVSQAKSLSPAAISKLAPQLQALVADLSPENAAVTEMRSPRVQTVTNELRETLYPVTVRSSQITAVKAAGIQTNSDYAGWSTARVSYEQLLLLTRAVLQPA